MVFGIGMISKLSIPFLLNARPAPGSYYCFAHILLYLVITPLSQGLQKQLTLTDDQTTKVAAIYKESAESFEKIKMAAHGNSGNLTKSSLSLRTATIKKIKGVLTPKQASKFDVMVKQTKKGGANDWGEGWIG